MLGLMSKTNRPAADLGSTILFRDGSARVVSNDGNVVRLAGLVSRWIDDGTDKGTFADVLDGTERVMPARVFAEGLAGGQWVVA